VRQHIDLNVDVKLSTHAQHFGSQGYCDCSPCDTLSSNVKGMHLAEGPKFGR
jgi:hypothetical protein